MKARPTIFLSGVSHEFGSFRDAVEIEIQKKGCFVENQPSFAPDYVTVAEMLTRKLNDADAVIHIVGFRFGAEPSQRPAEVRRRSYTQMELDVARELQKPVYVFLSTDASVRDDAKPDEQSEDAEATSLQLAHRAAVQKTDHLFYFFKDKAELCKLAAEIPPVQRPTPRLPLLIAVLVSALTLLAYLGMRNDDITGYILYTNSTAVVPGAEVRMPDDPSKSTTTDAVGFFALRNVPRETPKLAVLFGGQLADLFVVNEAGHGYSVVRPASDPPPKLDNSQASTVVQLASERPELFRAAEPGREPSRLWPIGATIRVAFLDGTPELQDLVRRVARRWLDGASIQLDFDGEPSMAQARVTFVGEGAYGYIGTDALGVRNPEATMVLGTLEEGSPFNEGMILHEFGHLLGLVHENQSPSAQRLLDWGTIYRKAELPPLLWSRQLVDSNLRSPRNLPAQYADKPFDRESVMLVPLPEDWFLPPMRVEPGRDLSVGDREFIAKLYPRP